MYIYIYIYTVTHCLPIVTRKAGHYATKQGRQQTSVLPRQTLVRRQAEKFPLNETHYSTMMPICYTAPSTPTCQHFEILHEIQSNRPLTSSNPNYFPSHMSNTMPRYPNEKCPISSLQAVRLVCDIITLNRRPIPLLYRALRMYISLNLIPNPTVAKLTTTNDSKSPPPPSFLLVRTGSSFPVT